MYELVNHLGVDVGELKLLGGGAPGVGPTFFEHFKCLILQKFHAGDRPRCDMLRRSLGSVFLLPSWLGESDSVAFALMAQGIHAGDPLWSILDIHAFQSTKDVDVDDKQKRSGKPRRRPSSPTGGRRVGSRQAPRYFRRPTRPRPPTRRATRARRGRVCGWSSGRAPHRARRL